MNQRTRKALEGSIRKWERIVKGTGKDDGRDNCPLCKLVGGISCDGCPVSLKNKNLGCNNTPYDVWANHQNRVHGVLFSRKVSCPTCKKLAKKELDYLRKLRPTKKKKEAAK